MMKHDIHALAGTISYKPQLILDPIYTDCSVNTILMFRKSVPAFEWAPPDMLPPVGKPGIELSAEYRGLLGTAYSSPVKLDTSKPPSLPPAVNRNVSTNL